MIYIYGDSHANASFKNLRLEYRDLHYPSITMFRIGRDNIIINFNKDMIKKGDFIVISYGEVDCRCHVQRQIDIGKNEDDVINELVNAYIKTIKNNTLDLEAKVVIVGVIPPTSQSDFNEQNHEFPSTGKDEDRVRYTVKVNKLLEELSLENDFIYFNPYSYYTRENGTLKFEFSDNTIHLGDNSYFLEKFTELYEKLTS